MKGVGQRLRRPLILSMLAFSTAQVPGGAPSANSLLNDLRSMQFPGLGGQQPGQMGMGGQMPQTGGQMPQMGGQMPQMGGQMPQMGGQMPQMGGQMPQMGGQMPQMGGQMPQMGGQMPQMGGQMPQQAGMGMGLGAQMPGQMGLGAQMPQMGGQMPGQMGGQMGQPASMPAGFGMGGASGLPPQGAMVDDRTLEDFACEMGPRAMGWRAAKEKFRAVFHSHPPWQLIPRETLSAAMESGLMDLKTSSALVPEAADECGLGKLTIQLFSFATIDDPQVLPQLFAGFEPLASPVLTMMLDLPWAVLATTGWPLFGLLSQISLRKAQVGALNDDAVDGMTDAAARQFQVELSNALASKDGLVAQRAAGAFLASNSEAASGGSALGALTAMTAQAMASPEPQERMQLLDVLQTAFRQVIGNGAELDLALSTKWPLWGILHSALDAFAG